jgi:type IVB pilus formation R64 PilN family outer membrane protein
MTQREEVKGTVTDGMANIRAQIKAQRDVEKEQAKSVTVVKGVWLGAKAVKVSRDVTLPPVFHQKISFQFPDKPTLPLLAERLTKVSMIPVRVTADAYESIEAFAARRNVGGANKDDSKTSNKLVIPSVMPMPMPLPNASGQGAQVSPLPSAMNGAELGGDKRLFLDRSSPYFGTLYQLLDQISAVYGVGWDYKDGEIEISRLVTRIYQIANINDVNESSASVGKSGKVGTAASGGQEASSTDSASSDITNKITDKVDVVDSMKTAISSILTPNVGKVTVSTSGLISVHDTREIQRQVKEMVDAENTVMGRQVRMRITFLDMKTSVSNDMGFSWEYIVNMATRKYQTSISSPSGLPGGSTGFGTIGLSRISGTTQTDFFIKALAEMGNVAVMKDESFTIMNNRNVSVAAVDTFTYPARQTPGTTVGIGGVAVASRTIV